MKRTMWVAVALLLILSSLLVACAPQPAAPAAEVPAAEVPAAEAPATDTPAAEAPAAEAPAGSTGAPITVWVDTTREAGAQLYKTLHPDVADLINIELVDRAQFPAKVLLFNNTGSGWPDVVFAEPFPLVAQVADANHAFPMDLKDSVPSEIIDGFAEGALDPCTFEGNLYCLRNDLAQVVLWYDAKLMEEWGYAIPTTWEEYEELGAIVAKEHPDALVGTCGDDQCLTAYFQGSRCPVGQVVSNTEVHINTQDPKCIRAAEMLDRMIANGSVDTLSPFDPAFVDKVKAGNLLMLPAASWYGEYVFGGKPDSTYYQSADGQLGVALPLKWKDEDQPFTGFHGGSAWSVSRHTENPELAVDFAKFMSSSHEYQDTAVTFPAFLPAADVWAKTVASNPVYAFDPYPVLKDAAGMMTLEGLGNIRYDWQSAWNTDVIAAVQAGDSIVSALPKLQETYAGLAKTQGYEVSTD